MPLIINNIRGEIGEETDSIIKRGLKKIGASECQVIKTDIFKTSIDARKRSDIHFVHSVYAELSDIYIEQSINDKNVKHIEKTIFKPVISGKKRMGVLS